jgi:hypothetical protein
MDDVIGLTLAETTAILHEHPRPTLRSTPTATLTDLVALIRGELIARNGEPAPRDNPLLQLDADGLFRTRAP